MMISSNKGYYIFEKEGTIVAFVEQNIKNGKKNNWCARNELRKALGKLRVGGILQGRFYGQTRAGTDLENILFFNIGSSCFKPLMKEGVAFFEIDKTDADNYFECVQNDCDYIDNQTKIGAITNSWCIYEYSMVKSNSLALGGKSITAVKINKDLLSFKNDETAINCWKKIKDEHWQPRIIGNPIEKFMLDITINTSNELTIDKIKHMLDGIVSSLQTYNGNDKAQILAELKHSGNWLGDTNILGAGEFVKPPKGKRKKLTWKPLDDKDHLKSCIIRINNVIENESTEIKVLI